MNRRVADPRVADFVRVGKIRAALFLPQFIEDSVTGEIRGRGTGFVGVEIARSLAARIGVAAQMVGYLTPSKALDGLKTGACDLGFLGIEPSRAAELDFSSPLFQFDYTYLVPSDSTIHNVADVDRPGIRIAVVHNHASDLALRRIVKHAELIACELPDAAFDLLRARNADALAFPRDVLIDLANAMPGYRVLEECYGINRVGIAIRKSQSGWLTYIDEFVEEAKASGLIQQAIERGNLRGFRVEPPEHGRVLGNR